jgi:glycosyltransferase involved in cell wall biosynthesis/peptidoglycan/xylan/chitin deacetylase (PgdA/CDA1 family)
VSDPRFVSVVMCFLDMERYIGEAIESVFDQQHREWELVLVNDGSSDRSGEIARRYERRHPDRVRYVEHGQGRNLGKSFSRNAGVAASKAPLVMFFDADDVLLPGALRTLAGAISRHPEAAVAYGRTRHWFSWPGNPGGYDSASDFDSQLPGADGTVFAAGRLLPALAREDDVLPSICSALVRREALDRVGGWEESFEDVYDDFVLWTKLFATDPTLVVDETLSLYRKHPDSSCEQAVARGEWSPVDLNVARYRYLAWMERWLTLNRLGDEETWQEVEAGLEPYRHPAAPTQIDEVRKEIPSPDQIRGNLEHPTAGGRTRSHRIPLEGWVAGLEQPALAVEVEAQGRKVGHIPIEAPRPDVAAAIGGPRDARHGFSTSVLLAGMAPAELSVAAVLEDQQRVPLASVSARRVLRPEDRRLGSHRVSLVIVVQKEVGPLAGAIENALGQVHRPLEIVVVDDGSSSALDEIALAYPAVRYVRGEGEGIAVARRAGLRRSSGEFVAFLAPHQRLHPTAISAALRRLTRHGDLGFVAADGRDRPLDQALALHDGTAAGPALFRRLAVEAAGIPAAPAGLDDEALQLAVVRDRPGLAIADPMALPAPPPRPPGREGRLALLRGERHHASGGRERIGIARGEARIEDGGGRRRRLRGRRQRREGPALVLLYHRIAALEADPWQLGVSREHFSEQLRVLGDGFNVLPLAEVVARIGTGGMPRHTVAITFDDGYLDNLEAALPELQQAGAPATLFLAGGVVGARQELWWDQLERILLSSGTLPQQLALAADGWRFEFDLAAATSWSEEEARSHASWRVGEPAPTRRHAAFAALWEALWPLPESTRAAAMSQLRAWAQDPGGIRESHRTLTAEDVSRVAMSGLVDVGAHTVSHPRLASRPWEEQHREILVSRDLVEELSGRPPRSFAYPYGGLDDFTAATVRLVADAGFESACATWEGGVHAASDPWRLPRLQVPDLDGEAFEEWLAAGFEAS